MENEKNLNDIQEEMTSEEITPVEETVPAEDTAAEEAAAEETAASEEEVPAEETKPEEKKATPGKMALVIAGIVVVIAVIAALLMSGTKTEAPAQNSEAAPVETTVPVPTVPADGNPDDETCKGTYTVTDEEAVANADTVVVTIGDHTLTNAQLQAFYWMQVQSFLSSEYGSYMMMYGVLDYTQPLDTQVCAMTGSGTWQQFFLKESLNTWQNYLALADRAKEEGLKLSEEEQTMLDSIEETMQANAEYYGLASVEELLKHNIGAGADLEDYVYFQEMLMLGNQYYDAQIAKMEPTAEEVEAFFAEHEAQYAESGITKDGKLVDVRHVLFKPQGATADATTYTDEEWAACEAKAQSMLDEWAAGARDEESFAAMANTYSEDPGSNTTGGLYEDVQQGQMVPEFDAWCFDETREPGHYGMVKTTYGYHLMYYVGGTPIWENYARQDMISEKTGQMLSSLAENYLMEVDYSKITLAQVNLAG